MYIYVYIYIGLIMYTYMQYMCISQVYRTGVAHTFPLVDNVQHVSPSHTGSRHMYVHIRKYVYHYIYINVCLHEFM